MMPADFYFCPSPSSDLLHSKPPSVYKRPAAPNILNFLWVDQFDTLGLGKNTVIVTGTTTDSMLIFDPKKETFSVFRMPYLMPFYTRGLDGRIDDAKAGWKGRGLWMTYSSYLPKFTETKLGSVDHVQLRPNPLAK